MDMLAWIERFLDHCRFTHKAPDTITSFHYVLRKWVAFADGPGNPEIAFRYLEAYSNRCTRACTWMRLKSFVKFLAGQGLIEDWSGKIYIRQFRSERHETLTEAEVERMLAACDLSYSGRRDFTIMVLFYHTGARRDEVRLLKASDVDLAKGYFQIRAKGGRIEQFHLTQYAREVLETWMAECGGKIYLFRGTGKAPDRPLERSTLQDIINRAARLAGLDRRVHPHMFRHTIAQRLLDAGTPLEVVSKVLHHRNISTTMIYAKVGDGRAGAALDNLFTA